MIDEKSTLLTDLLSRNGRLFFTHDPNIAMGTVARDAKNKFSTIDELAVVNNLAA